MVFHRNKQEIDRALALQQLQNAAKLLGGTLKHFECSDRSEYHEKYVIEFGHSKKES